MDSIVLVAYASLTASITLLQQLLAYVNFTLDSEDLFCCYKQKKWFLWTMAAAKPWGWVRLKLILTMMDIYINSNVSPLTKFIISRRSTEFKVILSWNIEYSMTLNTQCSMTLWNLYVNFWQKQLTTWFLFPNLSLTME